MFCGSGAGDVSASMKEAYVRALKAVPKTSANRSTPARIRLWVHCCTEIPLLSDVLSGDRTVNVSPDRTNQTAVWLINNQQRLRPPTGESAAGDSRIEEEGDVH